MPHQVIKPGLPSPNSVTLLSSMLLSVHYRLKVERLKGSIVSRQDPDAVIPVVRISGGQVHPNVPRLVSPAGAGLPVRLKMPMQSRDSP